MSKTTPYTRRAGLSLVSEAVSNLANNANRDGNAARFIGIGHTLRQRILRFADKFLGQGLQPRPLRFAIDFEAIRENSCLDRKLEGDGKPGDSGNGCRDGGQANLKRRPIAWLI